MLKHLALLVVAASWCATTALAQEPDTQADPADNFRIVYFTHHDCPDTDSSEAGLSPDNPIDIAFDELWYAVSSDAYDEVARDAYDCRWIRTSGFMTWKDYYHYLGDLHSSAAASYVGTGMTFIVENFVPGSPVRSDLTRREMTIVARFYSLCAAAERAQKDANESWWLFGPCHYSYNHGLMLSDARVEAVRDATPQYLAGEANRKLLDSLLLATPSEQGEVEPVVRAWAAALQKGLRPYADATLAQYPARNDDDRQETYDFVEDPNSYPAYLLNARNLARLDLRSAKIQIFRPVSIYDDDDKFESAVGCVCLEASCADRWPLTEFDADRFMGPAACIALTRWDGKTWNW